jgi:hypothetical protein
LPIETGKQKSTHGDQCVREPEPPLPSGPISVLPDMLFDPAFVLIYVVENITSIDSHGSLSELGFSTLSTPVTVSHHRPVSDQKRSQISTSPPETKIIDTLASCLQECAHMDHAFVASWRNLKGPKGQ